MFALLFVVFVFDDGIDIFLFSVEEGFIEEEDGDFWGGLFGVSVEEGRIGGVLHSKFVEKLNKQIMDCELDEWGIKNLLSALFHRN